MRSSSCKSISGHTVEVPDYEQGRGQVAVPYLRFRADGVVEQNDASLAALVNGGRFGGDPEVRADAAGRTPLAGGGPRRPPRLARPPDPLDAPPATHRGRRARSGRPGRRRRHVGGAARDRRGGRSRSAGSCCSWPSRHRFRGWPSPDWPDWAWRGWRSRATVEVDRCPTPLWPPCWWSWAWRRPWSPPRPGWGSPRAPDRARPAPSSPRLGAILAGATVAALRTGRRAAAARVALAGTVAALGSWALLRRGVLANAWLPTSLPFVRGSSRDGDRARRGGRGRRGAGVAPPGTSGRSHRALRPRSPSDARSSRFLGTNA